MTDEYRDYLNSAEWRKKKKEVLELRGRACQLCGKQPKSPQIHHKTYKRIYNEDIDKDLLVVCGKCHMDLHKLSVELERESNYSKTNAFFKRNRRLVFNIAYDCKGNPLKAFYLYDRHAGPVIAVGLMKFKAVKQVIGAY